MTKEFASIELARLYEAQGYIQDALTMYQSLDDDVLEGGAEVRAAVKRLELALLTQEDEDTFGDATDAPADPVQMIASSLAALNDELEGEEPVLKRPRSPKEREVAQLMEKWVGLMVVRKRLKLFKRVRARV